YAYNIGERAKVCSFWQDEPANPNQSLWRSCLRMRLTIGRKLAGGLAIIILLYTVVTGFGLVGMTRQAAGYERLANDLRMAQVMAARLAAAVEGQAKEVLAYSVDRDLTHQSNLIDYVTEAEQSLTWLREQADSEEGLRLSASLDQVSQGAKA